MRFLEITPDIPVFLGLINDPCQTIDMTHKRTVHREETIRQCALATRFQAEGQFVRRIAQLEEPLNARYSVLIIGNAGVSKFAVLRGPCCACAERTTPCSFLQGAFIK